MTQEDIKQGKSKRRKEELQKNPLVRRILEYKRQGISDNQISKMPDIPITQQRIYIYIKECLELNLINRTEIEEAKQTRKQTQKDNDPNRIRILEGLRRGESDKIIARDTTIKVQQVRNIRLELIAEGLITQEEVDKAKEKAEIERQQRLKQKKTKDVDEEQLLQYLILGYNTTNIRRKLEISYEQYKKIVNKFIKEKRITNDEIRANRAKRKKENKQKVYEGLKNGMSQRAISEMIDETLVVVQNIIKSIKEEENISDEDINRWKNQVPSSLEKRKEVILEGLKNGLSRKEIIERYPEQQLNGDNVKNAINILKREGKITDDEIKRYRKDQRTTANIEKIDIQFTLEDEEILKYLREGYEVKKIASLIKKSVSYTYKKISFLCDSNRITREEIEQVRIDRQTQIERDKKEHLEDIQDIDEEQLFSYLILGYYTTDIRQKLNITYNQYRIVVDKFIEEKRITHEEIAENRKIRKEKIKIKILEGLKLAMTYEEIANMIGQSLSQTKQLIKEVKIKENITEEDIEHWRKNNPTSVQKRKEVVLEGLKQGLSKKEIIERYPQQKLQVYDISNCIALLKKEGKITKEEIRQNRQRRKENNVQLTPSQIKLLKYLREGYEVKEIAIFINRTTSSVYTKIHELRKKISITPYEIEQARKERIGREMKQQIEEQRKEKMRKLEGLKREIDSEVRFEIEPTDEKKKKIREYIDLCNSIYEQEKISIIEVDFLSKATQKIPVKYVDIINLAKRYSDTEQYRKALNVIKHRKAFQIGSISEKEKENFDTLEKILLNACKVQQAITLIKKRNTNSEVISQVTGLSRDEINILKIKLTTGKLEKILSVPKREKVIQLLLRGKDSIEIQKELEISDFEMEDIIEQAQYRKRKIESRRKCSTEVEVKQDSMIRIAMLCIKLGKKPGSIARVFKLQDGEIQRDIDYALQFGLIKPEQLKGVNPLEKQVPKFEQLEI